MTVEPGRLYPLYAGASSRAILAFLPEVDIARVLGEGLRALTEETILDLDELRERLAQVARGRVCDLPGRTAIRRRIRRRPSFPRGRTCHRVDQRLRAARPLRRSGGRAIRTTRDGRGDPDLVTAWAGTLPTSTKLAASPAGFCRATFSRPSGGPFAGALDLMR